MSRVEETEAYRMVRGDRIVLDDGLWTVDYMDRRHADGEVRAHCITPGRHEVVLLLKWHEKVAIVPVGW